MIFTCGMTNLTGTRYPPKIRWVRVRISTRGYVYVYEFLLVTPLLTDG
jgi:hypothetical protein